jgi:hypothetical protein
MPFIYFVEDEKGNVRCDTGTSCTEGENLPYRKCCTINFLSFVRRQANKGSDSLEPKLRTHELHAADPQRSNGG